MTINQWNLYEFRQHRRRRPLIERDYLQYADDMHCSDPTDLITREYVFQAVPILLCLLLLIWASAVDKNQDR